MRINKLQTYKHADLIRKPNFMLIPVNTFEMNDDGIKDFNEVFKYVKSLKNYHTIIRTHSGGISYSTKLPAYDIRNTSSVVEITLLSIYGMYRFQCRNNSTKNLGGIKGRQAFMAFKKMLKEEYNIDINDYAIENGAEIKQQIEKPLIKMEKNVYKDKVLTNVHHIDFHNSYPAGLVNTHPEFGPIVEKLYKLRKENEIYKAVLNLTIGYFQSLQCCGAKWAHLTRDAIKDNNDRIRELANRLKKSGRIIISYNTDGIWYMGDVYHGKGEGENLGQWHNDHVNTKFRARTAGAYEFIENGKYNVVLRGKCQLERYKPREAWSWGDIYHEDALKTYSYIFDSENGMLENNETMGW